MGEPAYARSCEAGTHQTPASRTGGWLRRVSRATVAAMAMINIPSSVDDPSYRYKMPRLISKVEGRGNGIKTAIMNMSDVAGALKRPPSYPTKFFGCELGAQSSYSEKVGEGERAI